MGLLEAFGDFLEKLKDAITDIIAMFERLSSTIRNQRPRPRHKDAPCWDFKGAARDGFESIYAAASVRKCTAATGE